MKKELDQGTVETLIIRINELSSRLEKASIAEYVEFLRNPRRIIYANLLGGLARGFGIGVGATVLAALFLYLMTLVVKWNLPVIGKFIAEIVGIVQLHLR
ncbi:MAG TPA: hypothetical protein GX509_03655 [Firmicutes bacterium]|nr:hypothetical protein [Bacillota bacterium]HHY97819.1 hypothetical protein [Bacillota bacterium]